MEIDQKQDVPRYRIDHFGFQYLASHIRCAKRPLRPRHTVRRRSNDEIADAATAIHHLEDYGPIGDRSRPAIPYLHAYRQCQLVSDNLDLVLAAESDFRRRRAVSETARLVAAQ